MQFGIKCGVFFWLLFSTNTVVAYRGEINFRRCTFAKGDRKVRVHGYMLRSRDVTLSRMTLRGMGDNILHRCSGKGARLIHSFVLIAVAVSTSLLGPVLPGQAATALPLPALAIISPGYLLQPRQYESYVEALRKASIPTIVQTGSEIDRANDNTAAALHRDATAVVERNPQHVPVVLIGHSRGGAVAAIAATEMNGMKRPPMLVLLDPVDTSPPTALSLIATPPTAPPTAQALTPVLIVSMPYGGYSSFYRTYYESACAPAQRNGEAFAAALAQRYAPRQRVLQIIIPDVGHTQLLDDRPASAAASVCAANSAVRDEDVRALLQDVIVRWVNAQTTGDLVSTAQLDAFVQEMTRLHPQIHLNYRVW